MGRVCLHHVAHPAHEPRSTGRPAGRVLRSSPQAARAGGGPWGWPPPSGGVPAAGLMCRSFRVKAGAVGASRSYLSRSIHRTIFSTSSGMSWSSLRGDPVSRRTLNFGFGSGKRAGEDRGVGTSARARRRGRRQRAVMVEEALSGARVQWFGSHDQPCPGRPAREVDQVGQLCDLCAGAVWPSWRTAWCQRVESQWAWSIAAVTWVVVPATVAKPMLRARHAYAKPGPPAASVPTRTCRPHRGGGRRRHGDLRRSQRGARRWRRREPRGVGDNQSRPQTAASPSLRLHSSTVDPRHRNEIPEPPDTRR